MRALLAAACATLALLALAPAGGAADSPSRWCGPGEATADLAAASGNAYEVHVVYAYPADGTDRFATLSLGIARDIAALDTWWRAQDSSHAPRFDLAAFPGCDTAFGQLDVTVARLPRPAGYYASLDAVLPRLAADLGQAPTSLDDPDKKYLVLYDGVLQQPGGNAVICGLSPAVRSEGGGAGYAAVFLTSGCGDGLGAATNTAGTMAHELIHNLGALDASGPPHACPTSPSHPCDSTADVLSPTGEYGRVLTELQLDIGRDDYYGHSGTWWDIQDSVFLEHVGQTLGRPTAPTGLGARNEGGAVSLTWQPASSTNGSITYRLYRDGELVGTTGLTSVRDDVTAASSHTWAIRAQDALGYYAPAAQLTYTLTTGAAAGSDGTKSDTAPYDIAPKRVTGLRARTTRTGIVLSWSPAKGPRPIAIYRVARNGTFFARVKRSTSLAVPTAKAKGTWVVNAIDEGGFVSVASAPLRVV